MPKLLTRLLLAALALLLAVDVGRAATTDVRRWQDLISFRPPADLQSNINSRGWSYHRLEKGRGAINLDLYEVNISKLPVVNGQPLSAQEFLDYVRLHFQDFLNPSFAVFQPYDANAATRWNSTNPLGATMRFFIPVPPAPPLPQPPLFIDAGDVVLSDRTALSWIFSTVHTDKDLDHPVSGNRQFGIRTREDGTWVFYTRAADRPTGLVDEAAADLIFRGADQLWSDLQTNITSFVNSHSGTATPNLAGKISERFIWLVLRLDLHRPSIPWIDQLPVTTLDAGRQFAVASNPNGVWSYGELEANQFKLFQRGVDQSPLPFLKWGHKQGLSIPAWPHIGVNPTDNPFNNLSGDHKHGYILPGHQIVLLTGTPGEPAILRFTAAQNNAYRVLAEFSGIDVDPVGYPAGVEIKLNDEVVWKDTIQAVSGKTKARYLEFYMPAGGRIEFSAKGNVTAVGLQAAIFSLE